jgi:hypothetical protein
VLGWYLAAAAAGATTTELRRLSAWLRGRYGSQKAARDGAKAHRLNHLEAATLPDGVRRYLLHLCPEHAAVLDAALAALSGPAPTIDPDTGEQVRDERSAGQRRADALIEVVRRAAAAEAAGTSPTATTRLIVTMSLADLLAGVGTTRTREGELLDAGTARRLACDADLIPAVLGTESQILDWGRDKRLFDGPLRAAIVARDHGCTFPGCGRPATWCQAHHVIHWLDGGKTALLNAALLCARHHTIVHRDNLTATVTAADVTWDLTPHPDPPTSPTGYPGGPRDPAPGDSDPDDNSPPDDPPPDDGDGDHGGGGDDPDHSEEQTPPTSGSPTRTGADDSWWNQPPPDRAERPEQADQSVPCEQDRPADTAET